MKLPIDLPKGWTTELLDCEDCDKLRDEVVYFRENGRSVIGLADGYVVTGVISSKDQHTTKEVNEMEPDPGLKDGLSILGITLDNCIGVILCYAAGMQYKHHAFWVWHKDTP